MKSLLPPEGGGEDITIDFRENQALDPDEVFRFLRLERYAGNEAEGRGPSASVSASAAGKLYYLLRPLFPVSLRKHIQRLALRGREKSVFPSWPVDMSIETLSSRIAYTLLEKNASGLPFIWFWPDGHLNCVLMTHDVETSAGLEFHGHMMELESVFGIRASY